jgi:hypothetical protein
VFLTFVVLNMLIPPAGVDREASRLRVHPKKASRMLRDHPIVASIVAVLIVFGMAAILATLASQACGGC